MQNTSALYRQILADPNHWFETSVVIGEKGVLITERREKILFGGVAIVVDRGGPESGYREEQIFSVRTSSHIFDNSPEVGKSISQEIEVKMLHPSGEIPRMAQVVPYVRALTDYAASEWIQQGVFHIDTRYISHNDDGQRILTLHGFDAMLKAEEDYGSSTLAWPATDLDVVREIAEAMDVEIDPRTIPLMNRRYKIPMPTNYSMREILDFIAAMYLGWFVMTETGDLRLIGLLELPQETRLLIDHSGDYITFGGHRIKV